MNPALSLCVAGLLVWQPCAAAAAEPEVKTVASIAAAPETPSTAALAPASNLPKGFAQFVATQLAPIMPGTQVFTVTSTGSMRPAFDDNTVLLTEPARFHDLQVGDIVVFRHSATGARIVHRIVERRKGGFWTKGDYNRKMDDELVTEANYLGRVYGIFYTSRGGSRPLSEPMRKSQGQAVMAAAR